MKVFHHFFILTLLSDYCLCDFYSDVLSIVSILASEVMDDEEWECAFGNGARVLTTQSISKKKIASDVYDTWSSLPVNESDVKFFLYVQQRNDENSEPIEINSDSLHNFSHEYRNFNTRKIIIIIHGLLSDSSIPEIRLLRDGFIQNEDFNIIVVDWSAAQYSGSLLAYKTIIKRLDSVAEYVRKLLSSIENTGMGYLNDMTIVGHSLGAHIAGITGSKLGGEIGRIVGLDPAGPQYSTISPEQRLSENDAMEVEVIHTDINGCGFQEQMGHYDFYVNGGMSQPGCEDHSCSHTRAYQYFTESLDPKSQEFFGRLCDDGFDVNYEHCQGEILFMGGHTKKYAKTGNYYVETNDESPYARGQS